MYYIINVVDAVFATILLSGIFRVGVTVERLLTCTSGSISGRYVIIQLRVRDYLHVPNLEVYTGKYLILSFDKNQHIE